MKNQILLSFALSMFLSCTTQQERSIFNVPKPTPEGLFLSFRPTLTYGSSHIRKDNVLGTTQKTYTTTAYGGDATLAYKFPNFSFGVQYDHWSMSFDKGEFDSEGRRIGTIEKFRSTANGVGSYVGFHLGNENSLVRSSFYLQRDIYSKKKYSSLPFGKTVELNDEEYGLEYAMFFTHFSLHTQYYFTHLNSEKNAESYNASLYFYLNALRYGLNIGRSNIKNQLSFNYFDFVIQACLGSF